MASKFDGRRNEVLNSLRDFFEAQGQEVLRTGSQELCLPIVGEDNEEGYLVVTLKVPKGSRDGDPYDGYSMAQEYEMKLTEKAEKAKAAAEKKAKKIERDKKLREEKARLKAEREGG